MKNITKLSIIIFLLFGLFYSSVKASIYVPGFNLTINQHTVDGDDKFTFKIAGSYINESGPSQDLTRTLNIQTVNGIATNTDFYQFFGLYQSNRFYLTQDSNLGWSAPNIECHSDNSLVTTIPINNGVLINAEDASSIVCDFSNTKKQNKIPVLFIPGVMGTEIFDGVDKLWVDFMQTVYDNGDQFLDPLQFSDKFVPFNKNLTFNEVIGKITIPLHSFDYSKSLIEELKSQYYTQGIDINNNLFTFPYDWRYGISGIIYGKNITNVDLLKQKIQDILIQTGSDKIDIIAHSTGGLLLKKYVMDNLTNNHINKAVFVGVPNMGAPTAINTLLNGSNFDNYFLEPNEIKKNISKHARNI